MQPNQAIRNKQDSLKHFYSSQILEIVNLKQMEKLLMMNVPPKVWEDASKRNLLSFNSEFIQEIKIIEFEDRKIENIYLIYFLTNLTELDLYENNISDISSISKLKNLKKINLERNYIQDISSLQSLPDLTHLYLQYNLLTSYTLTLPNLIELSLGYNKLKDKSGLQHSPKLERLNLFQTEITDLHTILHQLFCLKELYLSSNQVTQISYLSNFVDLQILKLVYNQQLQNIKPLKFCTQLIELRIRETSVADIWPLQFLKNLKILDIGLTKIVDLHPLQHLQKLEYINALCACIIDVSPLSKLTQLKTLTFRNNKIINADTLKHHNIFYLYDLSDQKVPARHEFKFYSKILSVHKSHKQIRKIQAENRASKFRESLTHYKKYINLTITEQNQEINNQIEIVFSHNSYADQ
ncbi:Conserved_hypothetical protein [Hexamita inflata]|uniref:Uncharacterized protein n=1 Tax=Hexamita inflata TaxID=28002 RepID=A0AA86UKM1_9EUKA|nr:Conserved hypothetical protein [Hexamita inflata]